MLRSLPQPLRKPARRLASLARCIQRRALNEIAHRSNYRFLVRDWSSLSDPDLAARVLATDYFKRDMVPAPLPLDEICSLLLIAPHQDDEAIGAGGTLLLAQQLGIDLHILFFTDGAQDNTPESTEEMIATRQREAQAVCDRVGATMHELGVSNLRLALDIATLERLGNLLRKIRPHALLVPWLLDYPVKHRLVNHVLWLAQQREALPECEVWGYQVHNALFPNAYVDLTDVIDAKRELIECHASQIHYYQAFEHLAVGPAAWNAHYLPLPMGQIERCYYGEIFFTVPLTEHLHMMERFYLPDPARTYRHGPQILPAAQAIQQQITQL